MNQGPDSGERISQPEQLKERLLDKASQFLANEQASETLGMTPETFISDEAFGGILETHKSPDASGKYYKLDQEAEAAIKTRGAFFKEAQNEMLRAHLETDFEVKKLEILQAIKLMISLIPLRNNS